jgi:predicted ribosome quality control (RQC) complex YloA/Tae2 family protein
MTTAFHIYALVNQLQKEITGLKITATEFYKKERAAYFFFKSKPKMTLCFLYHPVHHGIFLVPASKINITTREKPWPIFGLDGAIVNKISQIGFDRIFEINISVGSSKKTITFEAIGTNGNILLLDDKRKLEATLRKKSTSGIGKEYNPVPPTNRVSPLDITANKLKQLSKEYKTSSPSYMLEKSIAGLNHLLAKEIIFRSKVESKHAEDLSNDNFDSISKDIHHMTESFKNPEKSYLYDLNGKYEAFPFKLSSVDIQPESFKTLSLAMKEISERRHSDISKFDEEKNINDTVKKVIKKLVKRLSKIEIDIENASDYKKFKINGELLKINFNKIKKGMKAIEVENIYENDKRNATIKLDPSLSPNENAESYFKKYRKGREGLNLLKRRYEITQSEIEKLKQIKNELDISFESAKLKYEPEIQSLLPKQSEKNETAVRLPYKEYKLSTGLTIFVGKDGSDNDRTTFDFTRPYELWFHTQQCPGSHVVIKFPNKSFEPSKMEIEETASIAAWFSKARKDSMVPVIYTQRRYVRKPRKAKAGLVTVEREKSVMVEPSKPD